MSPGTAITGQGSIALTGIVYTGNDVAVHQAHVDAAVAYDTLLAKLSTSNLSGQDLGDRTLSAGVYRFDAAAGLTGTLTLDARNDPNASFVFQIGSALTTASNSQVNVINGGANNGVFWLIGSSATLGTGTQFAGNLLADQSITMTTGAQITCGRAIAINAALTMDSNSISNNCSGAGKLASNATDFGSQGYANVNAYAQSVAQPVPEPSTLTMMGLGLLAIMAGVHKRRRRTVALQPLVCLTL